MTVGEVIVNMQCLQNCLLARYLERQRGPDWKSKLVVQVCLRRWWGPQSALRFSLVSFLQGAHWVSDSDGSSVLLWLKISQRLSYCLDFHQHTGGSYYYSNETFSNYLTTHSDSIGQPRFHTNLELSISEDHCVPKVSNFRYHSFNGFICFSLSLFSAFSFKYNNDIGVMILIVIVYSPCNTF